MRRLATIREIKSIDTIENADNIVQLTIDGWILVGKKDEFVQGGKCVFFEVDSILPNLPVFEFMEPRKFRVKTAKFRKCISQGLAMPISILSNFNYKGCYSLDEDVTELIGVIKHDPEAANEGVVQVRKPKTYWEYFCARYLSKLPIIGKYFIKRKGTFPTDITSITDETRWQNMTTSMKKSFVGVMVEATEKLDGCSATYIYKPVKSWLKLFFADEFMVCSRNMYLMNEDNSWWWETCRKFDIKNKMKKLYKDMNLTNEYLIIQGEITAPAIQSNKYKRTDYNFNVFNLKHFNQKTGIVNQFNWAETSLRLVNSNIDLKQVPLRGTYKFETLEELESFIKNRPYGIKSTLLDMIAEGDVIRLHNQNASGIKSFKYINPEFSLKADKEE